MCLKKVLDAISQYEISQVVENSLEVMPGCAFIAIRGELTDGNRYISDAIDKGAVLVITDSEGFLDKYPEVPVIYLASLKQNLLAIYQVVYQIDMDQYALIGITGTNGKTSIAHLIAQAYQAGYIGTLGMGRINDLLESKNTTPAISTLVPFIKQNADIRNWTIEVSSHGLVQKRLVGLQFKTAIFTNLSHDHLDYHGTMSAYAEAKYLLFRDYGVKNAIVNVDDEWGRKLFQQLPDDINSLSYSMSEGADLYPTDIKFSFDGMQCTIMTPLGKMNIQTRLIGHFNLANLLALIGCMICDEYATPDIYHAIKNLTGITGRMEVVTSEPTFVVDYAHTPDALGKALQSLKQICQGDLWCVFGCGGDRDQDKRPMMGAVATDIADRIVITSDNPRNEDPNKIIFDIKQGISNTSGVKVEPDRKAAIEFSLMNAKAKDMVLIAGKGHENYQILGNTYHDFSDQQIILEAVDKN